MAPLELEFELAQWPAAAHVRALTTTRVGGHSCDAYASLNLGGHVGDQASAVQKNRTLLKEHLKLPTQPIWLNQIHGTKVIQLNEQITQAVDLIETADGSIASRPGVVCAIMTADCMPVFLTDRAGQQVALVHAGWRGLAHGIVETAIAQMRADPSDILVWAGPSIGPANFEVGLDVQRQLGGSEQCYLPHTSRNKVFANLYRLLGERLTAIGVGHYSHSAACTFQDQARFFSYRRDGQCGRIASLIWMQ